MLTPTNEELANQLMTGMLGPRKVTSNEVFPDRKVDFSTLDALTKLNMEMYNENTASGRK